MVNRKTAYATPEEFYSEKAGYGGNRINRVCSYPVQIALLLFLSVLMLTGCETNPAEIDLKYEYSVYAYLLVGESVDINNPVSVRKHLDPYKPFLGQKTGIIDADVLLKTAEDPVGIKLEHIGNGDYIVKDSTFLIQPNTTYDIEIIINEHTISARTETPQTTTFENIVMSTDTLSFPELDKKTLIDNPVKVSCPPGEERIIYIETYCLEDYQNAFFRYNYFGGERPEDQEQYESPTGGFPRRLGSVGIYSSREAIDPNYIVITDYESMFFFYGRNRFSIYVIDRNYYEYLYNTISWENGGVQGAYGIFGSGVGQRFYLDLKPDN